MEGYDINGFAPGTRVRHIENNVEFVVVAKLNTVPDVDVYVVEDDFGVLGLEYLDRLEVVDE